MTRGTVVAFATGLGSGLLVTPVLIALSAWRGLLGVRADTPPPAWEATLAHAALDASVAREAGPQRNPTQVTDDYLLDGMKIFRDDCAGCHGDYGKPSRWGSTLFYPRVPQFAEHHPHRPDWQVFWIVKHGLRYSGMGGWGSEVPDSKQWMVATFLSRLDSLPPAVERAWTTGVDPRTPAGQ